MSRMVSTIDIRPHKWLQQGKVGERGRLRNIDIPLAEVVATTATNKRKEDGYSGESDSEEGLPHDERIGKIEQSLIDNGMEQNEAHGIAASLVSDNLKYQFIKGDIETPAFFSVKPRGGAIIITLNLSHPAYEKLVEILEEDVEEVDAENLRLRLEKSREGLKILLSAWARYEDEQPDGHRRSNVQDARVEWGRMARQFLNQDNP